MSELSNEEPADAGDSEERRRKEETEVVPIAFDKVD